MAINPMQLMKMKERWELFNSQHPKVAPFFAAAGQCLQEGTIIEMKVTVPGEGDLVTNIRLTAEDMETIAMLKDAR